MYDNNTLTLIKHMKYDDEYLNTGVWILEETLFSNNNLIG